MAGKVAGKAAAGGGSFPRILVFSTPNISDPGIDLAGSSRLHCPPTVDVISLPCTSGIRPEWILFAVERGFDGVFVAADGEECPYLPDCTSRAAGIFQRAQDLLAEKGYAPERVRMAAICSVCASPFVEQIKDFTETLKKIKEKEKGNGGKGAEHGL